MPLIDLGTRCLLQIHGPDAIRYLNGQVTQDVRLLAKEPAKALPAFVTDAKGRLQGYVTMYLRKHEPLTLWVEAPQELREIMFARLSRYLIADDAEIDDVSEEYRLLHVIGEQPVDGDFFHPRYGLGGFDRWVPAAMAIDEATLMSAEAAEALRMENGIPLWGRELTEGMLAPEAGLEQQAISYQKGCYIGQEVISRVKSAGKMNRTLTRFLLDSSSPVEAGTALLDESGTEVGVLTSIAHPHALGYLHKKGFGQTTFALAGGQGSCRIREE